MKQVRLIAVGRLKASHWRAAAAHYHARLVRGLRFEEVIVKDADARLSLPERLRLEGERLLKPVRPADILVCLDEAGQAMPSMEFANWMRRLFDSGQAPCFVIGGAYGLADEVKRAAARRLSFGPMTLPHELARVVLLEQLYRAEQILAGTGYHH